MAGHHITEENPVRWELEGLDFERCAALHNLIVERGWVQRGLDPSLLDRRTWWECFGSDSTLAGKLHDTVISFLKIAWGGYATHCTGPMHDFHRVNSSLSWPERLVDFPLNDNDESENLQYLTLYTSGWPFSSGHALGLVLEQESFSAVQTLDMEHIEITLNERQTWMKLEEILECLLEMIEQGKVIAVDASYSSKQERTGDWIMPSYTEHDLEASLDALNALITAIETRMPSPPPASDFDTGFVDNTTAPEPPALFPPETFARRFLERARRPRFTYLAPGLRIASTQPFATVSVEGDKLRPVLLFQSPLPAYHDFYQTQWGDVKIPPFHKPFHGIQDYPSGLYLTEYDPYNDNPYENGCKLLLPFAIGEHGWARMSDGALFGENIYQHGETAKPFPTGAQLFQTGFNHFTKDHDIQLQHVLWRWTDLVETGVWQVDGDGIVGGIEKWRDADTEEHWEDYQLPMDW